MAQLHKSLRMVWLMGCIALLMSSCDSSNAPGFWPWPASSTPEVRIREVEDIPQLYKPFPEKDSAEDQATSQLSPQNPIIGKTLDEVIDEYEILVPTQLPEGFSLDRGVVGFLRPANAAPNTSVPVRPFLTFVGDGGFLLTILEHPVSKSGIDLSVKPGFAEAVTIDTDTKGYLIRGVWSIRKTREGEIIRGWNEESSKRVAFIMAGSLVEVEAEPARAVTDEQLLEVARSLEHR